MKHRFFNHSGAAIAEQKIFYPLGDLVGSVAKKFLNHGSGSQENSRT
jgi:hypothetical protein